MKRRAALIIITFAATTVFWCLVVLGFGFIRLSAPCLEGTDAITQLRRSGYHYLIIERSEARDGTLVVDAIHTNSAGAQLTKFELLRTNLAPSQTMLLGLRREKAQK